MTWIRGVFPLALFTLGTIASISPLAAAPQAVPPDVAPAVPAVAALPQRFADWLAEVDPLISEVETELFAKLEKDYQRDAFIEEFWKVRDPYPRTARNELKERWPLRVAEAKTRYGGVKDDRARMLLVHGPPAGAFEVKCSAAKAPVEVWAYQGTEWTDVRIALVFVRVTNTGPARLWRPTGGGGMLEEVIGRSRDCMNGSQLIQIATNIRNASSEYERSIDLLLAKPQPSSLEWVSSFVAYSTDSDGSEGRLAGELELIFPGRYQQRTVVQGLIGVETASAELGDSGGYRSYDFRLIGEVLLDGKLFETFRYRFDYPATSLSEGGTPPAGAAPPAKLPLSFQRLLRPGDYKMIVKVEDLASKKILRFERDIEVPAADAAIEMPTFRDPETEKLFAEATAALKSGDISVRLIPPESSKLLSGPTRFDTLVAGTVDKVEFYLDDKKILTRNRPPFNVEVDLGAFPSVHTLRADALDAAGAQVAGDQLILNSGGYRFVAKLREPRPGKRYEQSLQARVEVEVPGGRSLDRVEIFLNETRVATLYQEPFVQAIVLPSKAEVGYVRAVAYLPDGNSTEDMVFINAPPGELEEVKVQFVELYSSVLGRDGRPVQGLGKDDFQVYEDGVKQQIARFEEVENLPIHIGVMIDTSASMIGILDDVRKAALSFFQRSLEPKDRAAVITFSSFPRLAVELTADKTQLGRGLAGLAPEGKTALYDSVMFGLYYFAGIKGQRAILLLSDGRDEGSRFDFEQTLDYARRAGVTLYTIGYRLGDLGARGKLQKLAEETGGSSFFIDDNDGIAKVYESIEREMRSQLLIAYQSNNRSDDGQFRRVELKVGRPDVTVKTLSGYYP
jgi:Ca-activated chloride channel family protein